MNIFDNGERRRDLSQALLVIDGPDKGEWRAWNKDSFVLAQVWDARRVSEQPKPVTYRLRRHPERGLVWASEANPALIDPYQD